MKTNEAMRRVQRELRAGNSASSSAKAAGISPRSSGCWGTKVSSPLRGAQQPPVSQACIPAAGDSPLPTHPCSPEELKAPSKRLLDEARRFNFVLKVYWIISTQNHYSSLWDVLFFFFFLFFLF